MRISVHPTNDGHAEKIMALVDQNGKEAISSFHVLLLGVIGSFPETDGCTLSVSKIIEQLPGKKPTLQTVKRHLAYLQRVGAISVRGERGNISRRLASPISPCESLRDFRVKLNTPGYKKGTHGSNLFLGSKEGSLPRDLGKNMVGSLPIYEKQLHNHSVFLGSEIGSLPQDLGKNEVGRLPLSSRKSSSSKEEDFLQTTVVVQQLSRGSFSSDNNYKDKDKDNYNYNYKNKDNCNTPLKPPSRQNENKSEDGVMSMSVPHNMNMGLLDEWKNEDDEIQDTSGSPPVPMVESFSSKAMQHLNPTNNVPERIEAQGRAMPERSLAHDAGGEPLMKYVGKTPKSQMERKAQAIAMYNNGHLVNPLGKPNTKGRRLMPSRARPVGSDGGVTISQLWATYLEVFEKSFGDRALLENLLAGTRENISRYFDEMRQRFQDTAGYVASNRDLYEYLKYFHDAQRLQGLMKNGKYTGNIGYVHPNQMLGKVHIRRYYDHVLAHKCRPTTLSENAMKYQHLSNFVRQAFDKIRSSWGVEDEMVYCLVSYGYVVVGEFMHDFHGFGASETKRRIIESMASFLRGPRDKKLAIAYLDKIWGTTERNSTIESSIWPDWKSTCKDFVQLAQELAKKE